jgi:hypothetical protein
MNEHDTVSKKGSLPADPAMIVVIVIDGFLGSVAPFH